VLYAISIVCIIMCVCRPTHLDPMPVWPAASIWFEIWGDVDPGKKKLDFSRQISGKF